MKRVTELWVVATLRTTVSRVAQLFQLAYQPQTWTEVPNTREILPERIEDASDSSVYIDVEIIAQVTFETPHGQQITQRFTEYDTLTALWAANGVNASDTPANKLAALKSALGYT